MKYTGSKARISKDLTSIFNSIIVKNNIKTYVEPFVGGANVIENIICEKKYAFDNNKYLIALWNAFLNGYVPPEMISKETYHKVKANKDLYDDVFVGLTGICASYNGNWFSSYGAFGIRSSNGKIEQYYQQAVRGIQKQVEKLRNVKFSVRDYQTLDVSKMNSFLIYCDPPYAKNKMVYNDKSFNHEEFWEWVRKLSDNNFVVVSEYTAPDDFSIIWEKQLGKMFPKQKKDTPTEKLFVFSKYIDKYKSE